MLKAIFEDNKWTIYMNDESVLEYTLNFVPWGYILNKAVKYGKISEEDYFLEDQLSQEKKSELLLWFEKEIWPSKEFGRDLLNDYKDSVGDIVKEIVD